MTTRISASALFIGAFSLKEMDTCSHSLWLLGSLWLLPCCFLLSEITAGKLDPIDKPVTKCMSTINARRTRSASWILSAKLLPAKFASMAGYQTSSVRNHWTLTSRCKVFRLWGSSQVARPINPKKKRFFSIWVHLQLKRVCVSVCSSS